MLIVSNIEHCALNKWSQIANERWRALISNVIWLTVLQYTILYGRLWLINVTRETVNLNWHFTTPRLKDYIVAFSRLFSHQWCTRGGVRGRGQRSYSPQVWNPKCNKVWVYTGSRELLLAPSGGMGNLFDLKRKGKGWMYNLQRGCVSVCFGGRKGGE